MSDSMPDDRRRQDLPCQLGTLTLATDGDAVRRYAELTADFNPIHLDPEFASATPFGAPIIHGTMGLNLLIELIEACFGEEMAGLELEARFIRPILVGTPIRAGGDLMDAATGTYEIYVETDTGVRAVEGTFSLSPVA